MPRLACQDAAASGINLVRFWGFADGPTPVPSDAVQPEVCACPATKLHTPSLDLGEAETCTLMAPSDAVHSTAQICPTDTSSASAHQLTWPSVPCRTRVNLKVPFP